MTLSNEDGMYELYLFHEKDSFSSGLEHAASLTSTDLLRKPCSVIKSLYDRNRIDQPSGLSWKVHRDTNLTIIAFVTTPISTPQNLQPDLVSSSALKENDFRSFEFLCSESNPVFSVNKAAVSLFHENRQRLDELKSEVDNNLKRETCKKVKVNKAAVSLFYENRQKLDELKSELIMQIITSKTLSPLIVTGHALGGVVASLFTLSLLDGIDSIDKKKDRIDLGKKRPLCITFGSPLVGNQKLQQAISRSSIWNSCFLHVVSDKDPLPRFFITNNSSSSAETNAYMPFGTFVLCSDVNATCTEYPDSTLELLRATGSLHDQNQRFDDYGKIVEDLYSKAICKDFTAPVANLTASKSLHASIILQLAALGFAPHMRQQQQQPNIDINGLITKMERLEAKFILEKKTKYDPTKKLNDMKKDMAELEKYKKISKDLKMGYYDHYRNMGNTEDAQNNVHYHINLKQYWEQMVKEAEMKPQKEGAAFRTRWLYAGTNYRRMVEPLEIADYYRGGIKKDYVTKGRSPHYEKLEEWLNEGGETASSLNITNKEKVGVILTLDSLFWARVEEALISCKRLKDEQYSATGKAEAREKLNEFEKSVYELLKNYAVSPEIFLEKSSYMGWWNEYKAIPRTSYNSPLATFMSNPENYGQYGVGAFDFV